MVRLAAISVLIALAACGGGGDGTTTSIAVDPALAPFCDAFGALLVGPLAEEGIDAGDPMVLALAVDITREVVADMRGTAPPPIATEVSALADEYDAAFAVLERYGYDLTRFETEATPEDRAVLDAFGRVPEGPGAADPNVAIEAFIAENCAPGVTLPADF